MLAFLFRRLGQGLLVIAVMATLVFVGVYALGNPIDILISPEADQLEREQAIERLGLDRPMWVQFALIIAVGIGIPAGLVAGLAPRSLGSRAIMTGSILGFSVPNFWLGLMLILLFAVQLKVLPAGGRGETVDVL